MLIVASQRKLVIETGKESLWVEEKNRRGAIKYRPRYPEYLLLEPYSAIPTVYGVEAHRGGRPGKDVVRACLEEVEPLLRKRKDSEVAALLSVKSRFPFFYIPDFSSHL